MLMKVVGKSRVVLARNILRVQENWKSTLCQGDIVQTLLTWLRCILVWSYCK